MTQVGITLEIAQARLDLYLTAETRVLNNQSYEIAGRKMTRADLEQIREGIVYWSGHVERLRPTQSVLSVRRPVGRVRAGRYRMR